MNFGTRGQVVLAAFSGQVTKIAAGRPDPSGQAGHRPGWVLYFLFMAWTSRIPTIRARAVRLLDRVLDKGLVLAGDIKVSLAEVEAATIRIRYGVIRSTKPGDRGTGGDRCDISPGTRRTAIAEQDDCARRSRICHAGEC